MIHLKAKDLIKKMTNNNIYCEYGTAYISLTPDNNAVSICGSLCETQYVVPPPCITFAFGEVNITHFKNGLYNFGIDDDYASKCAFDVDIISTNSICLRFYVKKCQPSFPENINCEYHISRNELFRIAQLCLKK